MLAAVVTVAGGVSLAMRPHHDSVRNSPVAAAEELSAQPAEVAVVDGGTLRVRDHVIRLLSVEPPARGTSCVASDRSSQDCGIAAANALAAMVRDAPVVCRITGHDSLGRSFAICRSGGTELNSEVIGTGWARADVTAPALHQLEETARAEHRGLWAGAQ